MTEPLAWIATKSGEAPALAVSMTSHERASFLRRGFTVTALAAVSPIDPAEADLVSRLDDAWAGRGEYAAGDLDLLRGLCGEAKQAVRHLASRTTPEDGRPTWDELRRGLHALLSTIRAHAANYATDEHLDSACRNADSLLSRVPEEDR